MELKTLFKKSLNPKNSTTSMAFAKNAIILICVFARAISTQPEMSVRMQRNVGTCGVSKISMGLIINGKDTRRGEFPWIVALMRTTERSSDFFCGAVLISSTFVITGKSVF